jgi:hypothetical protein
MNSKRKQRVVLLYKTPNEHSIHITGYFGSLTLQDAFQIKNKCDNVTKIYCILLRTFELDAGSNVS